MATQNELKTGKVQFERPFDFTIGHDDMKYCKYHRILMIWHHKAMIEYCPVCWMEGFKPECDKLE